GCAPAPAPVVAVPPAPPSTEAPRDKPPAPSAEDPLSIKNGIPYFQGKVLHPGALRELGVSLADSRPIDVAVDLDDPVGLRRAERAGTVDGGGRPGAEQRRAGRPARWGDPGRHGARDREPADPGGEDHAVHGPIMDAMGGGAAPLLSKARSSWRGQP